LLFHDVYAPEQD
jgi:hypothetical protein